MKDYMTQYREKLITVEEALSKIKSGDVIGTSQASNEPTAIFDQLHTIHGKVHNIKMYAPMCFKPHPFLTDTRYSETFNIDVPFLMGSTRKSHALDYYPGDLHNGASRWVSVHHLNIFITAVSPMDRHGYFRIPLCLIHEKLFLENADMIIVEVNPNLPQVYGDTEVHISQVDYIVEATSELPYLPESEPSETEKAIGGYVADLVNDGDCIQLGIGGIPDAAAKALIGKHDLGIHSEMLTNSMVDLVESGTVTGRRKNLNPGKIVGAFAFGTQRLYDMLDDNPSVMIRRGEYVNDPIIVGRNDNFVSINSCMALDLTGQICSESIGSVQYSGTGGASDMAVGATHSKGGRNIIAVASTKKNGTISAISAQLPAGSYVSIPRNQVDYVVTEYGIASLRGRSVRERVDNLIAIAHPDFRAELRREAEKFMMW